MISGTVRTCDWAACDRAAYQSDGRWWHCHAHWLEHLRMAEPPAPEFTVTDLPALHALRWSDAQIAEAVGLSTHHVGQVRRSLGLGVWRNGPRQHGTHAGFNSHQYRSEVPCHQCRDAERVYQRLRKRAIRGQLRVAV